MKACPEFPQAHADEGSNIRGTNCPCRYISFLKIAQKLLQGRNVQRHCVAVVPALLRVRLKPERNAVSGETLPLHAPAAESLDGEMSNFLPDPNGWYKPELTRNYAEENYWITATEEVSAALLSITISCA